MYCLGHQRTSRTETFYGWQRVRHLCVHDFKEYSLSKFRCTENVSKAFGPIKFDPKNIGPRKFDPRKYDPKEICPNRNLSQRKFVPKKRKLDPTEICPKGNLSQQKCVPRKICPTEI